MMTRDQMIETINGGGSVLHEGKLHTRVETLPSKGQLAKSGEEKAAAADDLDAQIAKLTAQREALTAKESGGADDTVEELMKHTRGELAQKAQEKGAEIGENDTKAQIAEKILAKQ